MHDQRDDEVNRQQQLSTTNTGSKAERVAENGGENLLDAGLRYVKRGWKIFPVNGKKKPLTPNGFKDATTDEAKITTWWTATPAANIGMPTGLVTRRSVVDEDNKPWKGATGSLTIRRSPRSTAHCRRRSRRRPGAAASRPSSRITPRP